MAEARMAESRVWIVALIAVVGLVVVAGIAVTSERQEQQHLLSVSGTHELDVAPDQATLTFQVMTRSVDAAMTSRKNKALLEDVMAALRAQGVAASDIETTGVVLQRWTEWNGKEQTQQDLGYEQVTTIKVTTKDLDKVGSLLDAAVGAGANSVLDVTFSLQPATEEMYKRQALTAATETAKEKANLLSNASGAELGDLVSVSENSYLQPYYYNTKAEMAFDGAGATPISPQKVTIQAGVNLGYDLK